MTRAEATVLYAAEMDVIKGVEAIPSGSGATATTVGFFDGVHVGHQAVLGRTVQVAGQRGLTPVAVTFDRHPREVLTPDDVPRLITTDERKVDLIGSLGFSTMVVLEFTEELSRWSPEAFVRRVLVDALRSAYVVVGANFTFGHKAEGDVTRLIELGREYVFSAEGMELVEVDGEVVSSSSIRESVGAGDLEWPEKALGRRFVVDGTVVPGAGRGADLGFPTANLEVASKMLLPGEGVYAGKVHLGDLTHVAAINVGTNPTFGGEPLHVEAFLLDFEGDILGQPMAVEFWSRLRDEVKFDSSEELARHISDDVERTRALVT